MPLMTGTEAAAAKRSTLSCSKVRIITASTISERTRAVSSTGSPRPKWESFGLMARAWPPSWCMPTSKETRVRVELNSKIMASVCPLSGS